MGPAALPAPPLPATARQRRHGPRPPSPPPHRDKLGLQRHVVHAMFVKRLGDGRPHPGPGYSVVHLQVHRGNDKAVDQLPKVLLVDLKHARQLKNVLVDAAQRRERKGARARTRSKGAVKASHAFGQASHPTPRPTHASRSRWRGVDCRIIQEQDLTSGQADKTMIMTERIAATGSAYLTLGQEKVGAA